MALPSEGALDQSGQLICSAVDGLVQGRCLVSDRDGLAAFEADFCVISCLLFHDPVT